MVRNVGPSIWYKVFKNVQQYRDGECVVFLALPVGRAHALSRSTSGAFVFAVQATTLCGRTITVWAFLFTEGGIRVWRTRSRKELSKQEVASGEVDAHGSSSCSTGRSRTHACTSTGSLKFASATSQQRSEQQHT